MIRTAARTLGATAVVALLAVGASACSGSEGSSDDGSPGTTEQVSTATTNARLGDLSDLDGSADGLSGGDLDCYDVSLAFLAISLAPANALEGGDADSVAQIQKDIDTLRAQVPEAIAADFDTYAQGVEAYTAALEGIDLSTITEPATQEKLEQAGQALSTPEVTAAQDALEAYFRETCPT
jgi:hypothetical protein